MSDISTSNQPVLKVAVNVPLSREFDYLPPANTPLPAAGCRVVVPFGPRQQVGVVLGHSAASALPTGKLRRCSATLDEKPLLTEAELRLIRFTTDYYHHPIGEVVAAAMPAILRQGKPLSWGLPPTSNRWRSARLSRLSYSRPWSTLAAAAPRQMS